jgi:hypothetical protein
MPAAFSGMPPVRGFPGSGQGQLTLPGHFEQAPQLVTEDQLAGFFEFYRRELAPRLS